jgi:hypothetical protein
MGGGAAPGAGAGAAVVFGFGFAAGFLRTGFTGFGGGAGDNSTSTGFGRSDGGPMPVVTGSMSACSGRNPLSEIVTVSGALEGRASAQGVRQV